MNRKDIGLIAVIVAIALLLFLVFGRKTPGNKVTITLDGIEYGTYLLSQDQTIMVESKKGYNQVVIKDGMVWVEDANCPDKYCVKQGKANTAAKSLICLPHRLVVEINQNETDSRDKQLDAVSQ